MLDALPAVVTRSGAAEVPEINPFSDTIGPEKVEVAMVNSFHARV